MERKEVDTQQFIDHTLLASELMHNNFMMDLMDNTGVFPKTEAPTNLSATGNNENGELNFHNTIFQFVNNKQMETNGAVPSAGGGVPHPSPGKETDVEFLSLVAPQQGTQPAFPALSIEPTVPIDVATALPDDDLLYPAATINARKVLPHKKRISRKLKGTLANMEMETELELEQHKHHQHVQVQVPLPVPVQVQQLQVATYSCEICGYAVHTQIEFYSHLKEHYDPGSLHPQQQHQQQQRHLDVPQQQQQRQQQQQKEPLDMCGLSAQDKLQQEQAKLDQVFHDVQLNFDNFHNISHVDDDVVDDVGVNMVIHADAMSLHKTDDKPTTVVVGVGGSTTNDVPVVDDVEFSDTEDMLEGIRNVVDKVSIEDTCDELVDLELTTSGMRAPWFNNNFSDFSGLLLPGEPPPPPQSQHVQPPPAESQPVPTTHATSDYMTLNFEKAPVVHPKLELCHKKHYIITTAAAVAEAHHSHSNESNEQTLLVAPPSRTPTPNTAGSAIEQLQRSPLMISESFKLEDVEATTAAAGSLRSSPAMDEHSESFLMETADDKPPSDDPNDAKRKFRCDKCARDFNSYNALKYHQYTHTKERAYQCKSCERSFYTQSALKAHERTHSGDKPFKCEKCDYKFRQWGDLKYHNISRHTEVKAHMCEYCGKSFSRKYSLVVHRRIHTRERNYACQYCEKTFRASSYLLTHIKVHTGEKPYACAICDKKFRVSGDLKRHTRIHDPARLTHSPENSTSAAKKRSTLKQIEDEEEEDEATINNNKSDAICGETEQEILGL